MANPSYSRISSSERNRNSLRNNAFIRPHSPAPTSATRDAKYNDSTTPASGSRKRSHTALTDTKYESPRLYGTSKAFSTKKDTASSTTFSTNTPPSLVNTRYRLAGGQDTPTQNAALSYENLDTINPDTEFRRRWTSTGIEPEHKRQSITVNVLQRERNGGRHNPVSATIPASGTWGDYMLSLAGDLAGKMWDFGTSAFRGFTAGQGASYDMTRRRLTPLDELHPSQHACDSTPIPGTFPVDDYDYINDYSTDDQDARPAKRHQAVQGSDWVMVNNSHIRTPRNRDRPNESIYSSPAETSYKSHLPRPSLPLTASPRRSRTSTARLSKSPYVEPATPLPRTASFASPRSPNASPRAQAKHQRTPTAGEVQRLAEKRLREERQADVGMKKLNQQLKNMIREGREALAMQVEIEDDDATDGMDVLEDEGYAEGDYDYNGKVFR